MANKMVNVDNLTYCGKEGQEIFSKSVYNLDITKAGITLKDNVKGKEKIYLCQMATSTLVKRAESDTV